MADNTLIANATALRRLRDPENPILTMPAQNPLASVPLPIPQVSRQIDPNVAATQQRLIGEQQEYGRKLREGSGISQINNPFLRGLARTGEAAASIITPRAASFIPGTELSHQRQLGVDQQRIGTDLSNLGTAAKTQQEQALTDYTLQRPQIEQSKIDQRQQAVRDRVAQAAAARGQNVKWDESGIPTFEDDYNSEAFHDRQALSAMHEATAEKSKIQSDIQKNHYVPGTPEFEEAQRKMAQADTRLRTALGGLGLRAQNLALRQEAQQANLYGTDAQGNPLPGSAQIVGDEGQTTTVGSKFSNSAVKQQKAVGSFNDLSGSVTHTRDALNQFFNEGGSLSDPRIVAAMSDPHSAVGKVVNGQLVQGGLSPSAIQAINAVRQLREQAGILRSTTGGTASEAGAQRILDVVPNTGDSNAVALQKLEEQERVLQRLSPGMVGVRGGLSVAGQKKATGASSAPKAGTVENGYRFKGGNPSDPKNWEKQ